MGSNQIRALTDALTLYAWQTQGTEPGSWCIHADVNFTEARIGAEADVPIRFRLGIRRAKIHLILPAGDPSLRLDPFSIDREERRIGAAQLKRTKGRSEEQKKSNELEGKANGVMGFLAKLGFGGKVSKSRSNGVTSSLERSEEVFKMNVSGKILSPAKASWTVENGTSDRLSGSPWDANLPRALVRDAAYEKRAGKLEAGGIRFEVECAREDLIIEDLEIKDPTLSAQFLESAYRKEKEQAINQYIRSELQKKGLDADNIEDKFGKMVVLDFLIEGFDVRPD